MRFKTMKKRLGIRADLEARKPALGHVSAPQRKNSGEKIATSVLQAPYFGHIRRREWDWALRSLSTRRFSLVVSLGVGAMVTWRVHEFGGPNLTW